MKVIIVTKIITHLRKCCFLIAKKIGVNSKITKTIRAHFFHKLNAVTVSCVFPKRVERFTDLMSMPRVEATWMFFGGRVRTAPSGWDAQETLPGRPRLSIEERGPHS
jgi:hypothetical protein